MANNGYYDSYGSYLVQPGRGDRIFTLPMPRATWDIYASKEVSLIRPWRGRQKRSAP